MSDERKVKEVINKRLSLAAWRVCDHQAKAIRPDGNGCEITFPRMHGYRIELPEDRLTAQFNNDSTLELSPDLVGTPAMSAHPKPSTNAPRICYSQDTVMPVITHFSIHVPSYMYRKTRFSIHITQGGGAS